jgi:myo-inositol-1(or 4)-monophosphatase
MTSSSPPDLGTDLGRYLQIANQACDSSRIILDSYFGNLRHVDEKYQAGLVSEADRESEKSIVALLRNSFPDHGILGEEFGRSDNFSTKERSSLISEEPSAPILKEPSALILKEPSALWLIDPLDGTTNYVHQFPFFCISIGLEIDGDLVLGVVDAPRLGVRFHAVKGGGAFKTTSAGTQAIHASKRSQWKDGLFATGFSSYDNTLDEQLELLSHIVKRTRGIRRAGAAALDLCFVAEGVFDCFWEKNLSPWDTAAGVVIAREAGALATDMTGQHFNPRQKSIVCGTPALHAETLTLMNQIAKRKGRI